MKLIVELITELNTHGLRHHRYLFNNHLSSLDITFASPQGRRWIVVLERWDSPNELIHAQLTKMDSSPASSHKPQIAMYESANEYYTIRGFLNHHTQHLCTLLEDKLGIELDNIWHG